VVPRTIEVGPTKVRNQAKPLNYSKKKVVFVPIQSNRSNGWPLTRYTADDAAETEVSTQKCQVAAASTIWAIRFSSASTGDV